MARAVLAALLVAALVAGCGGSKAYSSGDVERAFRSEGFDLVGAPGRFSTVSGGAFSGVALAPRDGPFIVLVYDHASDAAKASKILQRQATSQLFEVREANVVVVSNQGVTAPMRIQINAALFQLS